jgi:uncharacterized membrane protein
MYSKSRVDALTDGVFAVAMTILVLNLTLPEAGVHDEAGLVSAIRGLWSKFFPSRHVCRSPRRSWSASRI